MLAALVDESSAISADEAYDIAGNYLIDHLGELVEPGDLRLSPGGRWRVGIELSVCPYGKLGQIGTLVIDAGTGEVRFSEEDRRKAQDRARALTSALTR